MAMPMSYEDPSLPFGPPARYRKQELLLYQHNPLIEALPPIYDELNVKKLLEYVPPYTDEMCQLPFHIRLHAVAAAADLFVPLPIHYDLQTLVSSSIRLSYAHRNPLTKGHWPRTTKNVKELQESLATGNLSHITNSRSFSVFGVSGMGKTTALKRILACYDQVIVHSRYHRRPFTHCQVVWLHLQCPRNGALSVLAADLLLELDRLLQTTYHRDFVRSRSMPVEILFSVAANLASKHSLGLLVIDEIQNLVNSRGHAPGEMLRFLVELENKLNIPVLMVGTPKAIPLFQDEFRLARRAAGQGDLPWDRMENNEVWKAFVEQLWKHQFTRTKCDLSDDLLNALYYESQGITDLAVKVYLLAQMHAIAEQGDEAITPERFRMAASTSLKLLQPFLEALRENNVEALKRFDDIKPIELAIAMNQIKGMYPVPQDSPGKNQPTKTLLPPTGVQDASVSSPASVENSELSAAPKLMTPKKPPVKEKAGDAADLTEILKKSQQQGSDINQVLNEAGVVLTEDNLGRDEEP